MSRIQPVTQPSPPVAPSFSAMQRNLGMVPNLYATLAHSPALFNGFLAFADALSKGRLTARQRELLALAIGQANMPILLIRTYPVGRPSGLHA
nr:hypothetical protein [Aeromonas veronii]